jgi:hypothetical protein
MDSCHFVTAVQLLLYCHCCTGLLHRLTPLQEPIEARRANVIVMRTCSGRSDCTHLLSVPLLKQSISLVVGCTKSRPNKRPLMHTWLAKLTTQPAPYQTVKISHTHTAHQRQHPSPSQHNHAIPACAIQKSYRHLRCAGCACCCDLQHPTKKGANRPEPTPPLPPPPPRPTPPKKGGKPARTKPPPPPPPPPAPNRHTQVTTITPTLATAWVTVVDTLLTMLLL